MIPYLRPLWDQICANGYPIWDPNLRKSLKLVSYQRLKIQIWYPILRLKAKFDTLYAKFRDLKAKLHWIWYPMWDLWDLGWFWYPICRSRDLSRSRFFGNAGGYPTRIPSYPPGLPRWTCQMERMNLGKFFVTDIWKAKFHLRVNAVLLVCFLSSYN